MQYVKTYLKNMDSSTQITEISSKIGTSSSNAPIVDISNYLGVFMIMGTNATSAEVDIDIGPGFQDSTDSANNTGSNFDDVMNTASDLQDRIREDKLPKDQGFSADEVVVTVQPSPPAEEPEPIDETEEQVTSGKTFSQQSQESDAAELALTTTEQVVAVPTQIITNELYQIRNTLLEMVVRTFQFFLNDQNGDLVTFLESDAWTLEVEVVSGPGGIGSNSNASCIFMIDGFCDMSLSLDAFGDGYNLSFTVRNTNGTVVDTIPPYDIDAINVGPRPLDIIFTDYPKVEPKGVSFVLTVSLWDEALGTVADPTIGLPDNITCSLALNGASSLDGTTIEDIDGMSKNHILTLYVYLTNHRIFIVKKSFCHISNVVFTLN